MIARSYAPPVDPVTYDARARRLVAVVMLAAIAFDQGGEPAAAIAATVMPGSSGEALAYEQLWLSAAVVAFATASWTASLRPEMGAAA